MKMKRYCIEVMRDFLRRGVIKTFEKNGAVLFDMSSFRPSFKHGLYKEVVRLYVGNGITMFHLVQDAVSFSKDGNILSFNAKDFSEVV